ncbi:Lrp/AsnC family transcriptional regulator [Salsipaludibacter albus]|jgi:DNA-binding Lrp family transcriptional regulator|uniref:Lrp/AsnC family transcriptional regulator n=1 Tax=Salsipaludibacter albus TaxID=2849650 RepID=UPI001EE42AA9|nr:Lrp/AsnC ligand binding domain-containing protein [Salsipaludibacter albus]MBY5162348.1 Lrp/AsnC ligand binding domain-containing protein [Salsipaludibacter albus]
MIHAFVLMNVAPEHIAEVAERTAAFDGVQSAHSVAGSEADVVAVLAVSSHDEIAAVVTEHLVTLPGILSTRTMIAFRSYSPDELDAAWEGIGD